VRPDAPEGSADVDLLSTQRPFAAVLAVAAVGTAAFCYVTGENLPVGLLPQISEGLHSSLSATGLLVTVYAGVVVLASAPLTHLTHRIPRRLLLSGLLGIFVLGTLGAAAAPSYGWLVAARALTALSQAVYWSVAAVTAAGLFKPTERARAVAGVFAGSSVGVVLGVPAGTWIGQQAGWRISFVVLAGMGLLSLGAVALLIPTTKPSDSHAAAGSDPDGRRYRVIVATTVLAVAGFLTAFTFISPFLHRVSGLAQHDIAPVLLFAGVAGTLGLTAVGAFYGRWPRAVTIAPVALLAISLFCLYAFRRTGLATVAFVALDSVGFGGIAIAMQTGVLVVAPRSTDIASSWYSASFNVGIASGPLFGGLALSTLGLGSTPLVGALLVSAALAVLLFSGRQPRQSARIRVPQ
jgi:MFS transporter, DHA1 family, inner membrane transport protein